MSVAAPSTTRRDLGERRHAKRRGRARLRPVPTPKPPTKRRRHIAFLLFSAVVIGVLLFGVVTAQVMLAQSGFQLEELSKRTDRLTQEYGELKLEVAELSSPARIAEAAKGSGLLYTDPDKIRTLPVKISRQAADAPPSGAEPDENMAAIKSLFSERP